MSAGDVLHMIIADETGTAISVELYGASDPNNAEDVGYGALKDYDGNIYTEVTIGTQKWIVENLRVTHYADGTLIPEITDQATWDADKTGARCWYNNDETTYADYGLLYNWYAVNNSNELCYFERDGVQETGWRIPTKVDFETLFDFLGGIWTYSGGKLKETGTDHWTSPNTHATDDYGFALFGGGRRSNITFGFVGIKDNSYLWSATPYATNFAYWMRSAYNFGEFTISNSGKYVGMSVRCVKSTSTAIPVTISVDSTPGFTISSEAGYAIIGNSTMRVTFMCDAFPTVGGGSFGIEVTDASSNVLLRIEADGSNLLGETGVFFDSDTMWPNYGDTLTLSRAIVTGDSLTVKCFGGVA